MSAPYVFTIRRGLTFEKIVQYKNPDKSPVNIDGWQFQMTAEWPDGTKQDFDAQIMNASAGTFKISAAAADTVTWPLFAPAGRFDIVSIDLNDNVKLLLEGEIVVLPEPLSIEP